MNRWIFVETSSLYYSARTRLNLCINSLIDEWQKHYTVINVLITLVDRDWYICDVSKYFSQKSICCLDWRPFKCRTRWTLYQLLHTHTVRDRERESGTIRFYQFIHTNYSGRMFYKFRIHYFDVRFSGNVPSMCEL